MKIFLLTPVYATTTGKDAATPVVHYFAKEWVKQGHDVTVFHIDSVFPSFFYSVSRRFNQALSSMLNIALPSEKPKDYYKEVDGVKIYGISYTKYIPHSRISQKQKFRIIKFVSDVCKEKGEPDKFIGHWEIPQMDILPVLKEIHKRPIYLVLHSNNFLLEKRFGKDLESLINKFDGIGFRNQTAQKNFIHKYGAPRKSFIAYSGVSDLFIEQGLNHIPDFSGGISRFSFVGMLIERKHPVEVLGAIENVYKESDFNLVYIGDGDCKRKILDLHNSYGKHGNLTFTGRIRRENIIEYLKQSQIFIMISKGEIFGLVYLEAMSLGLIPIGSRGEGIDGIIVDGENGFLCEPGNQDELGRILSRLRSMSKEELSRLSHNARRTAESFSDFQVAKNYIESIK